MKICYVSCSNIFGGVENLILQSLNELCKEHEVALILPKGAKFLDKFDKRVKIFEYKSCDKRYNLFLYLEIFKIIKNYEIIHSHGAKATQICYILHKFLNFKFVATKHNDRKGKIFNRVKNVIAVSKKVATTINHESKVIYFGIKPKIINSKLPVIFTISAVGRLDKIKGFDILINEVSKLKFDFILQIIGEGKERENLQNLIKSLNLQDKIKLLGFRNDIAEILANSHLQVISSLKEGLPLCLIEGIFYSKILISTPAGGGISEILDQNFICHHENLAQKISEIYENMAKFSELFKEKQAKFREILTLQNYILQLEKYYKGL